MSARLQEGLQQVAAHMPMRIRNAFKQWRNAPDSVDCRGVRIEVGLEETDPMRWLLSQRYPRQVFWSSRGGDRTVAGIGTCVELTQGGIDQPESVFRQGRTVLNAFGDSGAAFYGGFSFSPESVGETPWPRMGGSRFWMPRFELGVRDGKGFLACNLYFRRDVDLTEERILEEWKAVSSSLMKAEPLPTLICRRDVPDRSGWEANVRSALNLIDNRVLDKVVLARKAVYTFAVPVSATRILAVLREVTSNCFHFLLQPESDVAFMGTTPELLFRRQGNTLTTEALAGTRPRVSDDEQTDAYARELMELPKERNEQELVRRDLIRQLHLLADTVDADPEPEILRLERKQHLISRIGASLREGVDDAEILRALHPTPAVGGSPRANALRELPRLEPFSRGWYAAPVGMFDADSAEFAVAIRSGLVSGRDVNIYSGAGIVAGSDPASEWDEIENKISDFVKVTRGRIR